MALISALDSRNVPGVTGQEPPHVDATPDVSRAVHADAVRLNRGELKLGLACLGVLAVIALLTPLAVTWPFFGTASLVAVAWVVRAGFLGFQLQRANPAVSLQTEFHESREDAAGVADFRELSAVVTPVVTYTLMGLVTLVTVVQFLTGVVPSIGAAALVKPAVWQGEWWRLLSASYLHGGAGHLLANMGALAVVGHFIEIYDRPSRVPLVYLMAVLGGSLVSMLATSSTSIGASGGVMGLVGYLAVISRRGQGAPLWVRRRMLRLLGGTALIGIVGFFYIDNGAHLGGFLAGAVVGFVAAPRARNASTVAVDRVLDVGAWVAAAVLAAGATFTILRLLTSGA